MYNHETVVRGEIRDPDAVELRLAVALAFRHIPGHKVTSFCQPSESLIQLYWHRPDNHEGISELPFEMDGEAAFELLRGWLSKCERSSYLDPFSGDGSSSPRGFKLVAREWGGWDYRALELSPLWAHYPK